MQQQKQEIWGFFLDELCQESILCNKDGCKLKHPRRFAGLCLQYLTEQKCSNYDQCQKNHLKGKKKKEAFESTQINGYCFFNLCNKINCENKETCEYLHPNWNLQYCVECLQDKHEDEHPDEIITVWNTLSKKVYEMYNIGDLNPENICAKKDCICKLNHNIKLLESNYCILYFQGICPNKNCPKLHKSWEVYKNMPDNQNYYKTDLYPCSKHKEKQKKIIEEQAKRNQVIVAMFNLKKLMRLENFIDVVFIVDCTASMQTWIDKCKDQIEKAAYTFMEADSNIYTIRLSFVGYRDYCDKENIIVLQLTEKLNEFTKFLSNVKAQGGGDDAEDLFSGLEYASNLQFAESSKSILVTFLFADAPCHGRQYHDGVSDDHANKIKNGKLESLMQKYKQIKQNNYFFCIQLNETTSKMYSIMKSEMDYLYVRDILVAQDIHYLFQQALSQSIRNSLDSKNLNKLQEFEAQIISPRQITHQFYREQGKKDFWENFNYKMQTKKYGVKMQISEDPMEVKQEEKGQNSVVFKIYDLTNAIRYIIKIKKSIDEKIQKPGQITDEIINEHNADIETRFNNQVKAQLLAKIYRERTKTIEGAPPIYFASPIIIELKTPFKGLSRFYAETFIQLPIGWGKYSNDGTYQDKQSHYYMSSFSHFTYEESYGLFVMTDLQGKNNLLTDPVVHYKFDGEQQKSKLQGIVDFIEGQHPTCSFICKALGYKSLTNAQQNIDQQNQKWELDENEFPIICESCNFQLNITEQQYQQGNDVDCLNCKELSEQTRQSVCDCCKEIFTLPLVYNLLRHSNLTFCKTCQIKCIIIGDQQVLKSCIYCKNECTLKLQELGENTICYSGLKYLQSLVCQYCLKQNKGEIIPKDDFDKGVYKCRECLQNKKQ